jgi:hypothetical protein
MVTEKDKDQLLLGLHGPIFLRLEDGERVGVDVSQTGQMSRWEPVLEAAKVLVKDGFLEKPVHNGTPHIFYRFTEKGKKAHRDLWAAVETSRARQAR